MKGIGAGAYARRIEQLWTRRVERPVVFSPRDWERVADWHARGVPLDVVDEALEEASARARKRGKLGPQRLVSISPAVEESWRAIVDGCGEVGQEAQEPNPAHAAVSTNDDPFLQWRERTRDTPSEGEIDALLAEFERGETGEAIQERLVAQLERIAGPDRAGRVTEEVDRRLEGFERRLGQAQLSRTRTRAVLEGLRRILGLPDLPA